MGTNALANGSVDAAKLANGAVTNDKLGPNAVTGAKIAGATITAANIAPGQVVKGGGSFAGGRQVVADGAIDTPVLTLPGVGQLRASCAGGATTISFLNESGAEADVTAWGVDDDTPVSEQTAALASGSSSTDISRRRPLLALDYQVGSRRATSSR